MKNKKNLKPILVITVTVFALVAVMCSAFFASQKKEPKLGYRPQERIPMVTIDRS